MTGEVKVRDERGRTQDSKHYCGGPRIYEGDLLIKVDDWELRDASLGMIQASLRGHVHTLCTLTFLRKMPIRPGFSQIVSAGFDSVSRSLNGSQGELHADFYISATF